MSAPTQAGWPGRHARGEQRERLVALDHPVQRRPPGHLSKPAYARLDATHELPWVIYDTDGKVMARVASALDAAFYFTGQLTLPAALLAELELDSDG